MATVSTGHDYDRLKEVKQFDESKIGVKGLLDAGIATVPRFFHHPPENLPISKSTNRPQLSIPVIDLSGDRSTVIEEIRRSSSTLGFFQIVNHGIPHKLKDSVINDMKNFYEQPTEYKRKFYERDVAKGAGYSSNFDLYQSKAASWRDTFQVKTSPMKPAWELVPEMCRAAMVDWDKAVTRLGDQLMSILCEGLGINSDRLKELSCLEGRLIVSHYYPQCPQPELTLGLTAHTDPGLLTMVVQNDIGGLLEVNCGDDWAVVEPIRGAIVINIGDLLQIMSNDEYKSVEHRVLANPVKGARVSVVVFFKPSNQEAVYGPLPELISAEKPAAYQEFVLTDYMRRFYAKGLDGKTLIDFYRINNTKG